jgi:prephenate dehydrogenase
MSRFDTVTIIGVGLLGGSLGLALKARGLAGTVRGVGHRQVSLDAACDVGAIDEPYLDARDACAGAHLVVVCTPAALVPAKLDEILPVCAERTVVTDVASTKAAICAHARNTWPKPLRFVGSHPMAGSEKFGPEHAHPDLYVNSATIVQPRWDLAADAWDTVVGLWRAVGSTVVEMNPERHDLLIARTSHVPHVVSACLALLVTGLNDARPVIGNGFRDMTRIAAGRPEIWRDVCLTNRDAILDGIDALMKRLEEFRDMTARDAADRLAEFFDSARKARHEAVDE